MLQQHGVKISHDGKGRYQDNIFMERLWRTVKYEEVYLKAYAGAAEARGELGPTSTSTMTRGVIKPWDTGLQPTCSIPVDPGKSDRRWSNGPALATKSAEAGLSLKLAPFLSN